MQITDIRISILKFPKNNLKAFSTIILDDSLVIKDLRIFSNEKGDFVCMPSIKGVDGSWHEVVTLIDTDLKNQIDNSVIRAYHDELLKLELKQTKNKDFQ